jgi:hypothetical protein
MIKHVDKPRGTARQAVLWVGIWLLLAMGISLGLMWWAGSVQAAHCGTGLAAEDLAGNCRLSPTTPGALEVVGQAPAPTPTPTPAPAPPPVPPPPPAPIPPPPAVNQYILSAVYTADLFSTISRGSDNPWDHCIGNQAGTVCRVVMTFNISLLPKDRLIKSVKLKLVIPYVTAGLTTTYWRVGRYGAIGSDPKADGDCIAYLRASGIAPWIQGTSLLRTVGTKTLGLTKAIPDLKAAIQTGAPFAVAILSNREGDVDRFTVIGRYNLPSTAPQLIVGY